MKLPCYQVFQGRDGQWYFRIKSANGKIIAQSEGYTRERSAHRAARRLITTSVQIWERDR